MREISQTNQLRFLFLEWLSPGWRMNWNKEVLIGAARQLEDKCSNLDKKEINQQPRAERSKGHIRSLPTSHLA